MSQANTVLFCISITLLVRINAAAYCIPVCDAGNKFFLQTLENQGLLKLKTVHWSNIENDAVRPKYHFTYAD